MRILVYDAHGNRVKEAFNQVMPEGETRLEFQSGSLPSGIYLFSMMVEGKDVISRRIVIQK